MISKKSGSPAKKPAKKRASGAKKNITKAAAKKKTAEVLPPIPALPPMDPPPKVRKNGFMRQADRENTNKDIFHQVIREGFVTFESAFEEVDRRLKERGYRLISVKLGRKVYEEARAELRESEARRTKEDKRIDLVMVTQATLMQCNADLKDPGLTVQLKQSVLGTVLKCVETLSKLYGLNSGDYDPAKVDNSSTNIFNLQIREVLKKAKVEEHATIAASIESLINTVNGIEINNDPEKLDTGEGDPA